METCELNIHLPALSNSPDTPPKSAIEVHRINTTYVFDTSKLSYATVPQRLPKLAEIPFHPTEDIRWHRKFVCPSESVLTFELACSTSTGHPCNVEWWQDKAPKITQADACESYLPHGMRSWCLPLLAAIFITQHSTV